MSTRGYFHMTTLKTYWAIMADGRIRPGERRCIHLGLYSPEHPHCEKEMHKGASVCIGLSATMVTMISESAFMLSDTGTGLLEIDVPVADAMIPVAEGGSVLVTSSFRASGETCFAVALKCALPPVGPCMRHRPRGPT